MAEDRLEHRHGIYAHNGYQLTLMFDAERDDRWEVFYGAIYLGVLIEFESDTGWAGYRSRLPGDEDVAGEDATDDWRSAVDFLADDAGY